DLDYHQTLDEDSPPIAVLDPARSDSALSTIFTDEWLRGFSERSFETVESTAGSATLKATNPRGVTLTKSYDLSQGHFVTATYHLEFPAGVDRRQWGDLMVPLGGRGFEYDYGDPLKAWEVVSYQDGSTTRKTLEDLQELEG